MKLGIIFEAPFDKFEKSATAPAFASLRDQIITYARAIEKDPNVLIIDAFAITEPGDYAKRAIDPANATIATHKAQQTENITKAAKTATVAKVPDKGPVTPTTSSPKAVIPVAKPTQAKKVKEEPVKVQKTSKLDKLEGVIMEPSGRATFSGGFSKTADTSEDEVKPNRTIAAEDSNYVIEKIFETLKRTGKSVTLVTALAQSGEAMTIPELMKATGLDKSDVSSWLGQTGSKIKALEKPARGQYKLNYDAV